MQQNTTEEQDLLNVVPDTGGNGKPILNVGFLMV